MILMLMMNMLFSFLFIFLKHPLSMGVILLLQTILISLITGFLSSNFWFSYILFLIMVGGMLILFIYMTSVASNEKFKYSNFLMVSAISIMLISMIMIMLLDNMIFNMINFIDETYKFNYIFNMNLNKFLNYPSNIMLFLMIIYLFITLIAIVKITDIKNGPLRQKF